MVRRDLFEVRTSLALLLFYELLNSNKVRLSLSLCRPFPRVFYYAISPLSRALTPSYSSSLRFSQNPFCPLVPLMLLLRLHGKCNS